MVAINPLTRVDTSLELINANFAEIKETLENKVLFRDGSKTVTGDLDFDTHSAINTKNVLDLTAILARLAYLEQALIDLGGLPPLYVPTLKFNDKRNSAYAGAL